MNGERIDIFPPDLDLDPRSRTDIVCDLLGDALDQIRCEDTAGAITSLVQAVLNGHGFEPRVCALARKVAEKGSEC